MERETLGASGSALAHTPSYTQRHPTPPLWASPNGAPPCTPGATHVKSAPLPRPRRLVPRSRPAACAYQLCAHPPSRHHQCDWHARRTPRKMSGCRSVEHRRHVWRTHAVRHACHRCTTRHAQKLRQKGFTFGPSICALSGGCVGKGNPRGRRLCPCAHTFEHPTGSHCPPLGIPKINPPLPPRSHACQRRTPSPTRLVAACAPPSNYHPSLVIEG